MSDLTNNVIKAINEGKSFKEVLSSVARGFADCGFFECTNWKEIRESIFNSNVWAPDPSQSNAVNEKNDFPEANNVSELVNLLESYWNPDWDQILNISFKDNVESEQTDDQDLCNEFDIAASMEFFDIFAGGNSNMEINSNQQTLIENNIETTSQLVNPTSTVEVCTELNGGKEMVTQELAMTKHVDLDPQNDHANTSQIQRISFTRDPLPLVLSPSSFEELSSLTDGTNIIHNQCNSNITDVAISISTIPMHVVPHAKMHEERHYPLANQNYFSMPTKRLQETECSQIHTDLPLNPLHTEDFTQHLKTHSGDHNVLRFLCKTSGKKVHVCGNCQKGFSSRSGLKRHQIIHSGEKLFVCRDCQKAFRRSAQLKEHETIHSGEKPYICGDCKKTFITRSNLKTHQIIHSGEKPFVCRYCQKGFCQIATLKSHERTHSGERPYICGDCQKTFAQSSNLKRHQMIHSG